MSFPENKHFIIVAYYFPPLGLAGTARPLAMANYFATCGHKTTVVTVKPIDYPAYDQSQLESLHRDVTVLRVGSTDPARIKKIVPIIPSTKAIKSVMGSKAQRSIFPDSKVGFVKSALQGVQKVLREDSVNYVITTSPPVSIHEVGQGVQGGEHIVWIADFRDIWGPLSPTELPVEDAARAEKYLESIALKADLVTATSERTLEYLCKAGSGESKGYFLPNGYDEGDFTATVAEHRGSLGLFGTLNYLMGAEKLFEWVADYAREKQDVALSIRHTGYLDLPELPKTSEKTGMGERFVSSGFLVHGESVKDIRCNLANVIMLTERQDTSFIVPSKLFELLRAEPPLVAILPKGNAARGLLEKYKFERVYVVDTYAEFAKALSQIREANNLPDMEAKRSGVEIFERSAQMKEFYEMLVQIRK